MNWKYRFFSSLARTLTTISGLITLLALILSLIGVINGAAYDTLLRVTLGFGVVTLVLYLLTGHDGT